MRLIHIYTLALAEFFEKDIPPYFILSHRWGEDEMSYKDFVKRQHSDSPGFEKVRELCAFARKQAADWPRMKSSSRGYFIDYVWIDTCCIDKRSSAEVSEAINSMYSWYQNAVACFVYLVDVPPGLHDDRQLSSFRGSRWFQRGWTLQELLAPEVVIFCDAGWNTIGILLSPAASTLWRKGLMTELGERYGARLTEEISAVTGIPVEYLGGQPSGDGDGDGLSKPVKRASIAERMSWAAGRTTTRKEDEAYCLLGIFDINMPLIYGERGKAFLRLQEEIIKRSTDKSIFAWKAPYGACLGPIFAESPAEFETSSNIPRYEGGPPYELTNRGLRLQGEPITMSASDFSGVFFKHFGRIITITGNHVHFLRFRDRKRTPMSPDGGGIVVVLCEKAESAEEEQYQKLAMGADDVPLEDIFPLLSTNEVQPQRVFYVDVWPGC